MTDLFGAAPDLDFPANALCSPMAAQWDAVPADWQAVTEPFRQSDVGRSLSNFIDRRRAEGAVIYPAQVFEALRLTPLSEVKVVILGQDPYHGPDQAHGLAFSVLPDQKKLPPSLRNLFKELQRDLGLPMPRAGDLRPWARQGVLLLNTTLTVENGRPASHARRGWQTLTDALIAAVSAQSQRVVFMLWGGHAQAKLGLIDAGRHRVLQANHPSPLSALRGPQPFMGCGHFSAAQAAGAVVDWQLPGFC